MLRHRSRGPQKRLCWRRAAASPGAARRARLRSRRSHGPWAQAAISPSSRQRAHQTRCDLECLFSSRLLSLAELDQPRNRDANHARNCQCFAVYVAVQAAAVPRILAPVVVTLAKNSHMRRASRWIHRACACSTIRFHNTGLPLLGTCGTRAPEKLVAELTIQKFAILMHGTAWTDIDNSRHAEAKADFWCRAKRCLAPPKQHARHHVAVEGTCECHASWSRRSAHLLSRTSSLSLQCPLLHLHHVDFIAPVQAM